MQHVDVAIVGAGAAGLFCAGIAGQRGLRVLVLDHAQRIAEKIRISGGGRCNFTNRDTAPANFLGDNPHFCRSALSRYTPQDFLSLLQRYRIGYHEKHRGQLFCDRSAQDIIDLLLAECDAGGVVRWHGCAVHAVRSGAAPRQRYLLDTDQGEVAASSLVVATGGLSIPKIGATDWGHRIAARFGLPVVTPRPALVPLTFAPATWAAWSALSGLALAVAVETGEKRAKAHFREDLLFTHRGLSGPAALQISSYWTPGRPIRIDLLPDGGLLEHLQSAKALSRRLLVNELATVLPARLADVWLGQANAPWAATWRRPLPEVPDKALAALAAQLTGWDLVPDGTEGYAKAEVTAGGVDTRALSGQSMESRQPGLYFIGEVVDVTGWLGGYNFQWAWASAHACAMALTAPA